MRKPLSILIFGRKNDARVVALKCLLVKCGITNFIDRRIDDNPRPRPAADERIGLFIVSATSVTPAEMEGINAEARRLAVPVLQL